MLNDYHCRSLRSASYPPVTPVIPRRKNTTAASPESSVAAVVNNSKRYSLVDVHTVKSPPRTIIHYGDKIRLYGLSSYVVDGASTINGRGGYIGYIDYSRKNNVLRHVNPGKQGNVVCLPPLGMQYSLLYQEALFTVSSVNPEAVPPTAPLCYGDVVILSDQNGAVWNNKIGVGPTTFKGYIGPRRRHTSGEMHIAFTHHLHSEGTPIYYGESDVQIVVTDSHRTRRSFNQTLTHYRREGSAVLGGYVTCDGRGHTLKLELHGSRPPIISLVSVRYYSASSLGTIKHIKWKRGVEWGASNVVVTDLVMARPQAKIVVQLSDGGYFDFEIDPSQETQVLYVLPKRTQRPARVKIVITHVRLGKTQQQATRRILQNQRSFKIPSCCYVPTVLLVAVLIFSILCFIQYIVLNWIFKDSSSMGILIAVVVLSTFETYFLQNTVINNKGCPVMIGRLTECDLNHGNAMGWRIQFALWETSETERIEAIDKPVVDTKVMTSEELQKQMPKRFIVAEEGNFDAALRRYRATVKWRREMKVDGILSRPHTKYKSICKYYPQCMHKVDKKGHPVYIEKVGKINLKAMRESGISMEDLFMHYIYIIEFIFTYVATKICKCESCVESDTCKVLVIFDMEGVGMKDLVGEVLEHVRTCTKYMQSHYPQRSFKVFLVNASSWFGLTWKLIKPMLNEATRQKTCIIDEKGTAALLLKWIDAENLPIEYGGECCCSPNGCFESEDQQVRHKFVDSVNNGVIAVPNTDLYPVLPPSPLTDICGSK